MTREEILGMVDAALRRCHGEATAARVMRELETRVSTVPEEITGDRPEVGGVFGAGLSSGRWIFRRDARVRSSRLFLGEVEIPDIRRILVEDAVDQLPIISLEIIAPYLQTIRGGGPAAATEHES